MVRRKKTFSRLKNFCWFSEGQGIRSAWRIRESAKNWENFVLLTDKRLVYRFTKLKVIFLSVKCKISKNERGQRFIRNITEVMWYNNWFSLLFIYLFIIFLHCTSKSPVWHIQAVPSTFQERKTKHF